MVTSDLEPKYRCINENDKCPNCEDDCPHDTSLQCFKCEKVFHALCKDDKGEWLSDNPCTKTFFDSFIKRYEKSGINSKRLGNFIFMCDFCITTDENNRAADLKSHVKSLENEVTSMKSDIATIKNILVNPPNVPTNTETPRSVNNSVQGTNVSASSSPWDDPERVSKLRQQTHIVIKKGPSSQQVTESDLSDIVASNGIHVDKTHHNTSGDIVVKLPTLNDREKLNSKLNEQFPGTQISISADLLPTISIANMEYSYTSEELLENLLKYHPEIKAYVENGDTLKVLNIRKQNKNNSLSQANVRVSNRIRKFIECNGNRVYMGLRSYRVYDHFHVKRCNGCQQLGHYIAQCTAQLKTCASCSENHETNNCTHVNTPDFVPTCCNCKKSENVDCKHKASSLACPHYKAAQARLQNSILYYSKNL